MLEVKNVEIAYLGTEKRKVFGNGRVKEVPTVKNLSFTVGNHEIVGLVGESGSGKSTTIRGIAGLLGNTGRVTAGEILFDGENLTKKKEMEQIRGNKISMIFQQPENSFDPITTIGNQLYETLKIHHKNHKISKNDAFQYGVEMLEKLHFQDPVRIMKSYPFELSGGMCQRAAIALAMVSKPSLLLADEPTSALDVTVQTDTIRFIMELREEFHTSILMVTHNMGVIAYMADFVGVMHQGRVVEWGRKEEILLQSAHPYTQSLIQAIPSMGGDFKKHIPYEETESENGKVEKLSETHWIWR